MSTVAAGWWSQHQAHTLSILGPMVVIALGAGLADARAALRRHRSRGTWSFGLAGALSGLAAVVHVAVCPEHFHEAAVYGVFFAAAAVAQVGWAVAAFVHRTRLVAVIGIAGNLGMLALWALSRTVGLPTGPFAGEVERIGPLDLLASACETGVVLACVWALLQLRRTATATAASEKATAEHPVGLRERSLVGARHRRPDELDQLVAGYHARADCSPGRPATQVVDR
jgi:hypothetical protein